MEPNTVVGAIGTALAFCEIWKPGVSVRLEEFIGEIIDFVLEYKKDTVSIIKIAARNTEDVAREVIKGPQLAPIEEMKNDILNNLYIIRVHFLGYLAIFTYFLFLKPLRIFLTFLNAVGRGRAVGGIGIALNIIGLIL